VDTNLYTAARNKDKKRLNLLSTLLFVIAASHSRITGMFCCCSWAITVFQVVWSSSASILINL